MRNLYPRLAATNLKKNRRFYLPYLLACIVIVALFCIILTLASDPYLADMAHGDNVSQMLGVGVWIMVLFSAIILFYTNSTFTKQRKREFAIYNILGMEKRHISYVLFWESLYTAAMALFFGLVAAGVFSKLLQLVLMRLIGGETTFRLNISLMSIGYTVVFFGVLFLLLLLNTIRIIHLSNPVQLLRGSSEGEREPRSKWILALLGAVCLAAGYIMSLRTRTAYAAIEYFFPAVMLVIVGTYLVFIALSIVILKALRKNRRYYYKTSHFATVSGLIYRMSRNAAGLASICILSTMVLVTVSTTVSLYKGLDAYAAVRWPQDVTLTLSAGSDTDAVPDVAPVVQVVDAAVAGTGLTQSHVHGYRAINLSMMREDDATLDVTHVTQTSYQLSNALTVWVTDADGYASLTGEPVTLAPDEALAWTDGKPFGDTVMICDRTFRLRQLDSFPLDSGSSIMGVRTLYLVVPDLDSMLELRARQNEHANANGGTLSTLKYTYRFDLSGTDDEQLNAMNTVWSDAAFQQAVTDAHIGWSSDVRADGYPTLRSTYGSFLFLGFFLGFVFLLATVLIIYYKQVSEGYDDCDRFRIMQQVGMTHREVKATIRTQVLLMFFLPLVTAAIHIVFAFPLIKQIVFAFGLQNVHLFLLCTLGTFGVFALLYTFVYLLTARTYYRIVRMTD
ncbi:MAG: FtsX-like permease family protein [Oscillospiraceae bacterium]